MTPTIKGILQFTGVIIIGFIVLGFIFFWSYKKIMILFKLLIERLGLKLTGLINIVKLPFSKFSSRKRKKAK